jgi:hypothetical protein
MGLAFLFFPTSEKHMLKRRWPERDSPAQFTPPPEPDTPDSDLAEGMQVIDKHGNTHSSPWKVARPGSWLPGIHVFSGVILECLFRDERHVCQVCQVDVIFFVLMTDGTHLVCVQCAPSTTNPLRTLNDLLRHWQARSGPLSCPGRETCKRRKTEVASV